MTAATVGIVLVSHSAELAAGAAHLAAQVSGGTVTIRSSPASATRSAMPPSSSVWIGCSKGVGPCGSTMPKAPLLPERSLRAMAAGL